MPSYLITACAAAGLILPLAGAAAASPPPSPIVQISGLAQLVKDNTYHGGSDPSVREWEAENTIAVDPTNRKRLATAWIQDYQEAVVAAYSADGGLSWHRSVLKTGRWTWGYHGESPPVRNGNDFAKTDSTNDPVVSIGPALDPSASGIVYVSSIVAMSSPTFGKSAVVVNVSDDGGRSWSDPAVIDTGSQSEVAGVQTSNVSGTYIDQTYVAADPARSGHAYVMWMKGDLDSSTQDVTQDVLVSRTLDAGKTWTPAVRVSEQVPDKSNFAPQLVVLPDGRLLATYVELPDQPSWMVALTGATGPSRWFAALSDDQGASWTQPQLIASSMLPKIARLAAGPDGTAYVSWIDVDDAGETLTLRYRRSHDGVHWTGGPVGEPIASAPQTASNGAIAAPALAISSAGTIGVAFYDHRNDHPETEAQETDYWLRTSSEGGATWHETHLAGPFDASSAPSSNGLRSDNLLYPGGTMGDYQGMSAAGHDFVMSFVLGDDLPGANFQLDATWPNGTDVYFNRVRP